MQVSDGFRPSLARVPRRAQRSASRVYPAGERLRRGRRGRGKAGPGTEIEEFGGYAGADELLTFLREFAALARNAVRNEDHIYCWMSV